MRRWLAFAPVLLLVLLIAVSAFVLMRGGSHDRVSAGAIGRQAPTYSLAQLGGGAPVTNADFQGRPHLINMFASWCVPCRAEHPQLLALKARGVTILGVAYKDRPQDTRAYLNALTDPFAAVALDPDGRYGLDLGIAGVPETFVIGADGRIRAVVRGPLTEENVARDILPALAR